MVISLVFALSLLGILSCDSSLGKNKLRQLADSGKLHASEPLEVLMPSFSSIYQHILLSKCVSCHSGENPAAYIDLSSYESIRSAQTFPVLLRPLDAKESLLYQVVKSGSMPLGELQLNTNELETLAIWINSGARKNETDPVPLPAPLPTEPPD